MMDVPAVRVKTGPPRASLCALISAHLSYLCFAYPISCGCLACALCFVTVTVLVASLVNPTQRFGVLQQDWTTIFSAYELDIGKIDHWCLGGGNDGCRCEDPLVPTSRVELRSWTEAFKDNKRMIEKYMEDQLFMAELDVAIVGESAIEEMDGRWLGKFRNDELKTIGTIFRNHFSKERGADVEGVALGIAGDSAGNVLWRLIHGEMPDGFEPKIWWVSLGMNDLTRQQCSEEVVILGVLRVVEEILKRRPKARIVINSLLPMADLRGGTVVSEQDYRDAFSTYRGKRKPAATHYVRKQVDGREQIEQVSSPPKRRRHSSPSSDDKRHNPKKRKPTNRQLLEAELEVYSAKNNDNSYDIETLQRKLQLDILMSPSTGDEHERAYNVSDTLVERRLEEDIPKMARKDRYNPTLDREKHKQKKYNFFRKRRIPLWTSIYAINKQLFKFCERHDRVDFFDATNIFAERKGDAGQKFYTLLSDYISARGHPTQLGFLKWEDEMVKRIKKILDEMRTDTPDLFMTAPEGTGFGSGAMQNVETGEDSGGEKDGDAEGVGDEDAKDNDINDNAGGGEELDEAHDDGNEDVSVKPPYGTVPESTMQVKQRMSKTETKKASGMAKEVPGRMRHPGLVQPVGPPPDGFQQNYGTPQQDMKKQGGHVQQKQTAMKGKPNGMQSEVSQGSQIQENPIQTGMQQGQQPHQVPLPVIIQGDPNSDGLAGHPQTGIESVPQHNSGGQPNRASDTVKQQRLQSIARQGEMATGTKPADEDTGSFQDGTPGKDGWTKPAQRGETGERESNADGKQGGKTDNGESDEDANE